MLILRCELGEALAIGDRVKITVVNIEDNQVKLATDAPKDIAIHKKIQEEKKSRKFKVVERALSTLS